MDIITRLLAQSTLRAVAAFFFCAALLIQTVRAQPASDPLDKFVVAGGPVTAFAKSNNILYFGGTFKTVGLRTGGGVPVSLTTGVADPVYPRINGSVLGAIPDRQGGWYVGGTFTVVGGLIRTNLAHIRGDRTVDPNFTPVVDRGALSSSGGSLVLSGAILYIGGSFTNVNGQVRNNLAAVDVVTGAVTAWNPNLTGTVSAMVLSGTNLFVSGDFTGLGGQLRNRLASVDIGTGQVTAWNPNPSDLVQSMALSGGRLFVGGKFGTIAGQPRACLASFDAATGSLDGWNPGISAGGLLYSITASSNSIFVAGAFTSAGGSSRTNIAAIDATTGLATAWDAHPTFTLANSTFTSMGLYSNTIYIGGAFSGTIGGQARGGTAALDITTANATAWDLKSIGSPSTFAGVGNSLYVGGLFGAVGCVSRTNVAAFDLLSNQITAWNPGVTGTSSVIIDALEVADGKVFIAGSFTSVGGVTLNNLAAVDATTGATVAWTPNPSAECNVLATWNDRLYVGGIQGTINGGPWSGFTEYYLPTLTPTGWNPGIPNTVIQALTVDGDTLYVGGGFTTVNGVSQRKVASFDLTTFTQNAWNPSITNGSSVGAIAVSGGTVFLGGNFSVVGGFGRTNFVAVDAASAQVLPLVAHADNTVQSLAASSNQVFLAGNFSTVNGLSRSCFAALDLTSNQVTAWNPKPDLSAKIVRIYDNVLYAGGSFLRLGSVPTFGMAAFPLSLVGLPAIVPNTTRQLPNGSLQFQVAALGLPQVTVESSTNLQTWQPLQTVPLTWGNGMFTDTLAPGFPFRFYRVSVP